MDFKDQSECCFLSQKELIERSHLDLLIDYYEKQIIKYFGFIRFDKSSVEKENEMLKKRIHDCFC